MPPLLVALASSPRRRAVLAALAFLGMVTFATCNQRTSSPTAPGNVPRPTITTTISPVPVRAELRSGSAASPSRIDVRVNATFHNAAGVGARITALQLVGVHSRGATETRTLAVNVPLAANATVVHSVTDSMELPAGATLTTWRFSAVAVGDDERPVKVAPVDAPVALEAQVPSGPDVTVVAAGDIARCEENNHLATASLIDPVPGTVLTLGDHVYPSGTPEQFANCYDRGWGRHRARTRPSPGNHDWDVAAGGPYFDYFGINAGPFGLGYYSFDLGSWHIVSLNSVVPAGEGSAQLAWLKSDLAASGAACTLAYWHHPLFSSGPNGNTPRMADVWRVLDEADADVVLASHDHMYERFAPQDAAGRPDSRGLRSFVVGTGGGSLYPLKALQPNSEAREHSTFGVLKLNLRGRSYEWEFLPAAGQSFRDSGTSQCITR
jgi:3',5'-cyclic AMP phosphodiesterase CpdA